MKTRNHYVIESEERVVRISLNRRGGENLVSTVDLSNLSRLLAFDVKWIPFRHNDMNSFYAVADTKVTGKRTTVFLHRWLMDCDDEKIVHRNHDTLDNREDNLRVVPKNTTRLGAGIHYDHSREQWFIVGKSHPQSKKNKLPQRFYDTEEQAEEAYRLWCGYWKEHTVSKLGY